VSFVTDMREGRSEIQVFDARGRSLGDGPVARVLLPRRVPHGFHATWVSSRRLAGAPDAVGRDARRLRLRGAAHSSWRRPERRRVSGVTPIALLGGLLRELARRTQLGTAQVSEAIIGCVTQTGEQGGNVGKSAALEAGWSDSVSVATVNHFCASSLWAFNVAVARIATGEEVMVAGGVESMSRVPMASDQPPFLCDPATVRRLHTPPMGISADAIATLHGIRREEAEAYAVQSQQRAAGARTAGRFSRSLVPVADIDGHVVLEQDETIRPGASVEKLLTLTPYFAEIGGKWADALVRTCYPQLEHIEHIHHAGNSPAMADGASVALLGSAAAGAAVGLRPRPGSSRPPSTPTST